MPDAGKTSADSLREFLRGAGGGLLFGTPLLFTMEMWWHGFLMPWWKILLLLAVTAAFVWIYTRVGGFRRGEATIDQAIDVTISFGIGVVVATAMLFVLGQISPGDPGREIAGKIALETIPVAMGVSVARVQLGARRHRDEHEEPGPLGQALVAAGGAMLFAFNVAPTEEPMLLGIENEWWRILLLLVLMVPVAAILVFFADFQGGHGTRRAAGEGRSPLSTPLGESVVSVVAALTVSAALLWFFGRIGIDTGVKDAVHQVVTLGFVATLGSSAARLLV